MSLMPTLITDPVVDHGSVGAGTSTPDLGDGLYHRITLTGATRTIAAPTYGIVASQGAVPDVARAASAMLEPGTLVFVEIKNASGGATTVTWNAAFAGAPGNPANGQRKIHQFMFDGSKFSLMSAAPDIPN